VAVFLKHTGCDRCGSSDALAHYSDGSTYCFSCGIVSGADASSFVPSFEEDEEVVRIPSDLSHEFPQEIIQWLKPTELTIGELIRFGFFYSRAERGLVRLLGPVDSGEDAEHPGSRASAFECRKVFGGTSQGLRLRSKSPKTIFTGSKEHASGLVQHDAGGSRTTRLCIVEDSLSAVKAGRVCDSLPLFGSSISNNKLSKVCKNYKEIVVWLDSDKLNAARNICDRVQLMGKLGSTRFTELDPKYMNAKDVL
jgi:hypothetical protein